MDKQNIKAGFAKVDITPEMPATLGGMFKNYKVDRVLDKLYSSSVSLSDEITTMIWISCDLAVLPLEMTKKLRDLISERTGVKKENINISATHTHTAPISGEGFIKAIFRHEDQIKKDETSAYEMHDKIIESAVEAFDNMKYVKMGYATGKAEKCCFNRRFIMSNGKSRSGAAMIKEDRLMNEGPVDDDLNVVWFEDDAENIMGVIVNFASHAAILYGYEAISADYPGYMKKVIGEVFGKDIPILFLQGCCGNVNPFNTDTPNVKGKMWGRGLDGYKRIGGIIAGEVIKLIESTKPPAMLGRIE